MNGVSVNVTILIFIFGIVSMVAIVATFVLCIYLREFPDVKHGSEFDLKNNKFKKETQLRSSNKKTDKSKKIKNNKHNNK